MNKLILSVAALAAFAGAATQPAAAQNNSNHMSIRVAGWEVQLGEPRDSHFHIENVPDDSVIYPATTKAQTIQGSKTVSRDTRWRPRRFYSRQGIFEVGFNDFRTFANTYSGYPASESGFMDLDIARSLHIAGHVTTVSQTLSRRNTFGITMALGLSYDQYFLETATALEKSDMMLRPYDPGHRLQKSKLRTLMFHIPLLLEWQLSSRFFIAAGGYADVLFWSDAKWKSPKEKLSSPYINFLNAGLTARIGFRDWYFFGNYALTELFKTGRGPVVSPYTVGIGFLMW